ncbi:MAG: hypothetical protein ABH813_03265 [Patescibacteria group bacterium]
MSFETTSSAILIISFLILAIFIYRKIPVLINLPAGDIATENGFFLKIKNKVKNLPGVKSFSGEVFLQKIISRARVWSLKADHKTANWLKTLRQKTQKKKLENGSYWQEIKNSKDTKK